VPTNDDGRELTVSDDIAELVVDEDDHDEDSLPLLSARTREKKTPALSPSLNPNPPTNLQLP